MKYKPVVVLCKRHDELLAELLQLDLHVCLVLDALDRTEPMDEGIRSRCLHIYNVSSFDALEELAGIVADLLARDITVSHVLSHHEFSQLGAGYLESALIRPKSARRLVGRRDKRAMKHLVGLQGVTTARFVSVPDRHDEQVVESVESWLGFPVIVKPAAGFGTMNTTRADDRGVLTAALSSRQTNPLIRSKHLIVEEFIEGEEVCVDALWRDGECLSFVAHRYLRPKLSVMSDAGDHDHIDTSDGSTILDPIENESLYSDLRHLQGQVNFALEITDGATHLEVFVRRSGELVFGEIANRIGGIWIPLMLSEYFGTSIWRVFVEAQLFGRAPSPATSQAITGVNLRPSRSGTITRMPSRAELTSQPGVRQWVAKAAVGDRARLDHPAEQYLLAALAADGETSAITQVAALEARAVIEVAPHHDESR